MLKKWFIEKCCFTAYCTVQWYKIVLKAWKQSALEHLQRPVLRQPRAWESRVGEAALPWCPGWSWQLQEVPSSVRSSGQRELIHVELLGSINRLPPLESVREQRKSFISAPSHTGRNSLLNSVPRWSLGNSSCFYKAICSGCGHWILSV